MLQVINVLDFFDSVHYMIKKMYLTETFKHMYEQAYC